MKKNLLSLCALLFALNCHSQTTYATFVFDASWIVSPVTFTIDEIWAVCPDDCSKLYKYTFSPTVATISGGMKNNITVGGPSALAWSPTPPCSNLIVIGASFKDCGIHPSPPAMTHVIQDPGYCNPPLIVPGATTSVWSSGITTNFNEMDCYHPRGAYVGIAYCIGCGPGGTAGTTIALTPYP